MEVYANALAQAVRDLEEAERVHTRLTNELKAAQDACDQASQTEEELREVVMVLQALVTGEPRKRLPL